MIRPCSFRKLANSSCVRDFFIDCVERSGKPSRHTQFSKNARASTGPHFTLIGINMTKEATESITASTEVNSMLEVAGETEKCRRRQEEPDGSFLMIFKTK